MAQISISDYDEKNIASVGDLSDGSSFTGLNKVQPIRISQEIQETDGFEDGNYTSSPTWEEYGDGTASVQSTTVKNGSNALELSVTEGIQHLNVDRGTDDSISDGDTYSCWINPGSDGGRFGLSNTANNRTDSSIYIFFRSSGDIQADTYDSNENVIETTDITSSFNVNSWYKVEITIVPSNSEAIFRIYDNNGNFVGSATNDTSGDKNLQYVFARTSNNTGGNTTYFDDVSYSATSTDSDTGGTGTARLSKSTWDTIASLTNPEEGLVVTESDETTTRPYEIESLDTDAREAWLWVYGSWDSDDSDQLVVAGGSGDGTDYSQGGTGNNPWGQTGVNAEMVQHLQDDPLTATDSSPTGNNGSVNGPTAISDGQINGAGTGDGTDDYIQFNSAGLSNSADFTIAGWFKTQSGDDKNNQLAVSETNNGASPYILLYYADTSVDGATDNGIRFGVNDGTEADNQLLTYTTAVDDGNWRNIIVTRTNTSDYEMFVDSASVDTASNSNFNTDSTTDSWLFGENGYGQFANTDIDTARFYTEDKSGITGWVQADYDASPKGGQTFFSWSGPQATSTAQTINAPTTTVNISNPDPTVQGTGTATISAPSSTLTLSTPNPTVQGAGTVTVSTPTTVLTSNTPKPGVNATGSTTISAPVTQLNSATPNPTVELIEALVINAPVTNLNVNTPNANVSGQGTATLNAPETSLNLANPEPTITGSGTVSISTPVTELSSSTPNPDVQGTGTATIQAKTTDLIISNPEPTLQNILENFQWFIENDATNLWSIENDATNLWSIENDAK